MRMKFLSPHSKQSYSVNYLYDKEKKSEKNSDGKIVVLHKNIDNETPGEWIETTKDYCFQREEVQQKKKNIDWNKNTMQIVVSVHPKDGEKLENAWEEIMNKTLKELKVNKEENNVAVWLHKDRDHHHIHILFSKMNYKGEKWEDTKIGYKLNDLARKFTAEYDLNYKDKSKEDVSDSKPAKKELSKKLYEVYSGSKNFEQFVENLKDFGIMPTLHENLTLSYTINHKGKDYTFHEDTLSQRYRFENISKLDRNKDNFNTFEEQKQYIQNSISKALNSNKNIEGFETTLREKYKIELIKHENSKGVYGFSFRQLNQQEANTIKGSQVGFSKNKIEYYLSKNVEREIPNTEKGVENNYIERVGEYIGQMGSLNSSSEDITADEDKKRKKRRRKKGRSF